MENLKALIDWFERNGNVVRFQPLTPLPRKQFLEISDRLSKFSFSIQKDFPEFSERLFSLKNKLSLDSGLVNVAVFGRIAEALSFLCILLSDKKYSQWKYIHKDLHGETKEKFISEFYPEAVFTATNILMQRLKNIHKQIDPHCPDIDGSDLIGKLFPNDAPKILFCEIDTKTGQNKQKGYAELFRGWVAAIRNKNAHPAMEKMTEIEAFQDIVLISMLMSALDNRKLPSRSSEQ